MSDKEKKEEQINIPKEGVRKPTLIIDDKEHVIEDMTDEQRQIINHINDVQNKINANAFSLHQLEVTQKAFVDMLRKSLLEE